MKLSSINSKVLLVIAAIFLMVGSTYAKRLAPRDVPPVILDGKKYSAQPWVFKDEQSTNGVVQGRYIQARNSKTDKLIWEIKIYEIKYNPKVESDVQDIFISSLKIVEKNLEIKNEAGDKFIVDVSARKVISGAHRVYNFKGSED